MVSISDLLALARSLDRLLALEKKHGDLIEKLDASLRQIADRMTALEAREAILVAEAKAAAATAASVAVSAHVGDLARRVGALDERTGAGRLALPAAKRAARKRPARKPVAKPKD